VSKLSRTLLTLAACAAAPVVAVTAAAPAQAWTWKQDATVYNANGLCVQGEAGIDHVRPGTFSGNLAYAGVYARGAGCGAGLANRYAAVRLEVHRWNGSAWVLCRSTAWSYGYTGVNQWGPTGPEQVFNYGGAASCGAGWYGTLATSYVLDSAGTWRGGTVWSGPEHVA
jgi:hypothetical protein